jgi:hypothetical protein
MYNWELPPIHLRLLLFSLQFYHISSTDQLYITHDHLHCYLEAPDSSSECSEVSSAAVFAPAKNEESPGASIDTALWKAELIVRFYVTLI